VISFRYHIVTIVAVFLALAVGLLAGSAFVEPGLVRQLRNQTDNLTAQVREGEAALSEARDEVAGLDGFVEAALPYLIQNRLLGEQVVVVAQDGVEDAVLGQTQRSLLDAGANVLAVISTRDQIASADPDTQARLAELLGRPDATAEELPGIAAAALASRLANGNAGVPEEDLLRQLLDDGFLAPAGPALSEADLLEIGSDGQVVVVLAGGQEEEPDVAPGAFAVPLVLELSGWGVPVAAGESATTLVRFVQELRDGGTEGVVTVDDLDRSMGGAALVLGLDELLATGEGGAYGIKDGARLLPPPL
jgi:hypothetical protein